MKVEELLELLKNSNRLKVKVCSKKGPFPTTLEPLDYLITDVNDDEESYGGLAVYLHHPKAAWPNTAILVTELANRLASDDIQIYYDPNVKDIDIDTWDGN